MRPADSLGADPFFLRLIAGVQEVLSERHPGLPFRGVDDVSDERALYRRWWAERRVDGVLVVVRASAPRAPPCSTDRPCRVW
ncbi:type 1 periplasmic-binding domain-containing protein [Streptomyces beihaiensis]|uniref:hypothetical protein n=1 Tax=Streptomyces beihaiensis TaxID=2984495 RepID=UPI00389B13AF